jgi:hypothetical protein
MRISAHPRGAAKECAGIRNLSDRAEVQLTEQLGDAGVTSVTAGDATDAADSHTNLRGNVRLYDDIAEVEESSTHGVEFHIDQFTHFTHDFPPQEFHVNNIWLKQANASLVFDTGGWFFYL